MSSYTLRVAERRLPSALLLAAACAASAACSGGGSNSAGSEGLGAKGDDGGLDAEVAEVDAGEAGEDGGPEPEPDAGASEPDADEPDAGELDAGSDAGELDAGSDAGGLPLCEVGGEPAVSRVTISVTADDFVDAVYFDGQTLELSNAGTRWQTPKVGSFSLVLDPSVPHVIAVSASNDMNLGAGQTDRGMVATLEVAGPDGGTGSLLVTDDTWLVHDGYDSADWTYPGFDTETWSRAVALGTLGVAPWGSIGALPGTPSWLWRYDPSTTADRPTNETTFFRKEFWIDTSGALQSAPPCRPQVAVGT